MFLLETYKPFTSNFKHKVNINNDLIVGCAGK